MDKSVTKGLKLLSLDEPFPKSCGRISVSGYDTAMPRDELLSALRNHFASCGQITDVHVTIDSRYEDITIWRCAYIYFLGEGAVANALKLDRSDVGGWKVRVRDYPLMSEQTHTPSLRVEGYDPSLSENDIKDALTTLFSSCGTVVQVIFFKGSAIVSLTGRNAALKALELDGRRMGKSKLVVQLLSGTTFHRRRLGGILCGPRAYPLCKKAKISTAE